MECQFAAYRFLLFVGEVPPSIVEQCAMGRVGQVSWRWVRMVGFVKVLFEQLDHCDVVHLLFQQ